MSDLLTVLGVLLLGLVLALPGWLAWTGRYRAWGRSGGLVAPYTPMMLPMGGGLALLMVATLIGTTGGPDGESLIADVLFLAGLVAMLFGVVGAIATMGPGDTYRKKPNGTFVTRLFLPRWYHEYLRDTFGGQPRR
ncbi:MAG: hypothetical protein JJT89_05010 [Nitriliruptoraceae bacterium]|nr:hypothetical protein [Nitriliruptoraceae bacterium]